LKPDKKILIIYIRSLQDQKPLDKIPRPDFLPETFKKEGGKMNQKLGERIKEEIRRRAFAQSDRLQHERQILQGVKHTLDALHEVTGLPRPQLKAIVNEAMLSSVAPTERFFSIKNQILIVSSAFSCVVLVAWLLFMI
jgi:hypothetical protein